MRVDEESRRRCREDVSGEEDEEVLQRGCFWMAGGEVLDEYEEDWEGRGGRDRVQRKSEGGRGRKRVQDGV